MAKETCFYGKRDLLHATQTMRVADWWCMYVCMHVYIHTYIHCVCACSVYVCIHTHTHTVGKHFGIHTHTHTHTRARAHTHTCVHICMRWANAKSLASCISPRVTYSLWPMPYDLWISSRVTYSLWTMPYALCPRDCATLSLHGGQALRPCVCVCVCVCVRARAYCISIRWVCPMPYARRPMPCGHASQTQRLPARWASATSLACWMASGVAFAPAILPCSGVRAARAPTHNERVCVARALLFARSQTLAACGSAPLNPTHGLTADMRVGCAAHLRQRAGHRLPAARASRPRSLRWHPCPSS